MESNLKLSQEMLEGLQQSALQHCHQRSSGEASTINACYVVNQNLWPQVVSDFRGFPDTTEEQWKIAELAQEIGGKGFDDNMEPDNSEELIARS